MTSWQLKCVQLMTDTGGDAGGSETECGSIASDCSNKDNGGTSDIHSDPCDIRETYLLCTQLAESYCNFTIIFMQNRKLHPDNYQKIIDYYEYKRNTFLS